MRIQDIKVGKTYETTQGIGECLQVGGTHPPSVKFRIMRPIPRGIISLRPRDVMVLFVEPEKE